MGGPIRLRIMARYSIPKRANKQDRLQMIMGFIRPQVKPDIDNVVKIIMDGLNGAAYTDDKQVVDVTALKAYGDMPRVEVEVEQL